MGFARQVEHVIKNQNMVDVYVMMEDYLHFLNDRIVQLETNKLVSWALINWVDRLLLIVSVVVIQGSEKLFPLFCY